MTNETYKAGRYINPLTDYGFKKVFGEKDIMKAFLTDLLRPASPIEDIIFLDKDLTGETCGLSGVIYDLRCRTANGEEFIVEMQNKAQVTFSDRILFYLSRSISMQIQKGERNALWKYKLRPVYGIFFTNFHIKGLEKRSIRTIQLTVEETGEIFSDKIKAFTLELPDYRGKPEEYPKTPIEYWLYNLANMETMTTTLPFQNHQPIFNKIAGIAEIVRMNAEERNRYNVSLDTYHTALAVMENERIEGRELGREEGMEEGIKKGIAIGAEKANIANARKMKECGIRIEIIHQVTSLTEEEIEGL